MKITKSQLRQIIKEELLREMGEVETIDLGGTMRLIKQDPNIIKRQPGLKSIELKDERDFDLPAKTREVADRLGVELISISPIGSIYDRRSKDLTYYYNTPKGVLTITVQNMKITKTQLRQIIKEEMSPEFLDSMQIMGLAIRAKREVEDARVSGDVNLDRLEAMLSKLVDGLPKVLK